MGEPLTAHTGPVWAVTGFADPGGRALLATAGHDATVRIWDPATGHCGLTVPLGYPVRALATVGADLAVGCDDGHLVLWLSAW